LTPRSGIRYGKNPDPGCGIPDHFSESLEIIVIKAKILKLLYAYPGSGIFLNMDPRFVMEKFGSGTNIPDPHNLNFKLSIFLKF
jgi:hypothetical protein